MQSLIIVARKKSAACHMWTFHIFSAYDERSVLYSLEQAYVFITKPKNFYIKDLAINRFRYEPLLIKIPLLFVLHSCLELYHHGLGAATLFRAGIQSDFFSKFSMTSMTPRYIFQFTFKELLNPRFPILPLYYFY